MSPTSPNRPAELSPRADVLRTAQALAAGDYAGWTYGSRPERKQIDCVQFLVEVLRRLHGEALPPEVVSGVLIDNIGRSESLRRLVEAEDPRTRGVQQALVSAGLGSAIPPAEARPGDLIQFWIRRPGGAWKGHAAVIDSVRERGGAAEARLFGSHRSLNGLGKSRYWLRLAGTDRKVYVVRYSAAADSADLRKTPEAGMIDTTNVNPPCSVH